MLIATGSVYSGKSRSFSTTAIPSGSGPHRRNSRDRKTVCTLHPLTPADVLGLQSAHASAQRADGDGAAQEEQDGGETTEDESRDGDSSQPLPPLPSFRRVNITSDYESSNDSPSGSDNNDTALGSEEPPGSARVLTPKHVGVQTGGPGISLELGPCSLCGTCARLALGQKVSTPPEEKVPSQVDPTPEPSIESLGNVIRANDVYYDLDQLANDPLLNRIAEWDYPIFDLQERAKDLILSQICYRVFLEVGLFESFRIPIQEFLNYFHILESGYREKPYHNRMHAADVLHGVYVLTSQLVPGFSQISADSTDSPLHRSFECGSNSSTPIHRSCNVEDTYGVMGANFPALELMALYTAAAMHDYDHPGRTNAFLVSTNAPQAVLYNDRSVLENHHAAAAWSLFLSKPEYNWLQHLDKAEFKRFRYVIIECILATDLKRHFEILAEFNAKVNDDDATGIDWSQEVDRLLVMEMCIKLADINGPCKAHDIHVRWTYRIAEEFYEQGDEEASLGLPISPFMDRRKPQLAKLQESFINHLVAPLCNAYGEAGLLPGYWVDPVDSDDEAAKDGEKSETTDTKSCDEDQPAAESAPRGDLSARRRSFRSIKARRVRCLPTQHLQSNYEHWISILREDAKNKEMENGYVDYSGHEEEGTGSEADMETTPSERPRKAAGEAC